MSKEIVFDIETQNTFAEVGNDFRKFRISIISIYEYENDTYTSFTEDELLKLWPILERAELLIGFNSCHFDLPIMNNYYPGDFSTFAHLDLMNSVSENLGRRIKLDDIAKATLDNVEKSADGLQAIRWWNEGKIEEIKKYCEQDVRITKEVYEFGRDNKQLFYTTLQGEILPFAVDFTYKNNIDNKEIPTNNINLTLPL